MTELPPSEKIRKNLYSMNEAMSNLEDTCLEIRKKMSETDTDSDQYDMLSDNLTTTQNRIADFNAVFRERADRAKAIKDTL